jgi:hypothetical protein
MDEIYLKIPSQLPCGETNKNTQISSQDKRDSNWVHVKSVTATKIY